MAFDLASILGLPPNLLPDDPGPSGVPFGPAQASGPFNWLSPQMVALAQSNAPAWSGAAAPGPTGAPAPEPAPSPTPAPQDPRMLAAASPAGNLTAADLTAPRPDAPWYRRFIGNMAAAGGAAPDAVADFKDPTYRDRVAQYRSSEAQKLFPNDPVGQALWAQGDPDIRKAMAKNEEIRGDAPDNTVSRNGKPLFTTAPAPKQGVDGDQGWTWDAKNGFQWGAARQPSYAEQTQAKKEAIEGRNVDSQIDERANKAAVEAVVAAKARGETLSAGEQDIYDTWKAHQTKPDFLSQYLNGADRGGGADPKSQPKPADDGKPYDPPADFKPQPNVSQYKMVNTTDGKMHVWRYRGGKLFDLGPAK